MQLPDFISMGATLISLVGSFLIAKITTKNEIQKLKLQFQREDAKTLTIYFSDVVTTINTFSTSITRKNQTAALKALGNFSAICPNAMRDSYVLLTQTIQHFDFSIDSYCPNQAAISELNKLLTLFEEEWISFEASKKRH